MPIELQTDALVDGCTSGCVPSTSYDGRRPDGIGKPALHHKLGLVELRQRRRKRAMSHRKINATAPVGDSTICSPGRGDFACNYSLTRSAPIPG